jgi:hypothetical protein
MKLRWIASSLLVAEAQFWRIKGYEDFPELASSLGQDDRDPQVALAAAPRAS